MAKNANEGASPKTLIAGAASLVMALAALAGAVEYKWSGSVVSTAGANNLEHEHSTQKMNREDIKDLQRSDQDRLQRITVLETKLDTIDKRTEETAKGMGELLRRIPK